MRTEELHGIQALDLDGPRAAPAFHPEQFARNFRQPHLLEGQPRPSGGARVPEKGLPVFWGKAPSGGGSSIPGVRTRPEAFSICFAVGIRQDAGWSFMTSD